MSTPNLALGQKKWHKSTIFNLRPAAGLSDFYGFSNLNMIYSSPTSGLMVIAGLPEGVCFPT